MTSQWVEPSRLESPHSLADELPLDDELPLAELPSFPLASSSPQATTKQTKSNEIAIEMMRVPLILQRHFSV